MLLDFSSKSLSSFGFEFVADELLELSLESLSLFEYEFIGDN